LYLGLNTDFSVSWFELPEDLMKGELREYKSAILELAECIEKNKPDRLIFVDHLPPPPLVLSYLSLVIDLEKLPPITFHIYGDFTYFAREWINAGELIKNHPLQFIVASDSQKKLLEGFLVKNKLINNGIEKLCFPVDSEEYYFNEIERDDFRKEHGLGPKDEIILYTGRISLQKNVDLLIKEFLKIKRNGKNYHLWLVGAFDDVGADLIGYESFAGYMFSKIQLILDNALPEQVEKIKFFGLQGKENLRKINSASDHFASFSLYHDEDFGMSPAEALSTALSCVLTDWGGYSSFRSDVDWSCSLVPVHITEYGLELDLNIFHDSILNGDNTKIERSKRALNFQKSFSVKSNVEKLEIILKKEPANFEGFTWILEQYGSALSINWSKSKFNKFLAPKKDGYYYDIYKNYISGLSHEK
jgi:glycosyltransferase involved in cell wall biosynthesis